MCAGQAAGNCTSVVVKGAATPESRSIALQPWTGATVTTTSSILLVVRLGLRSGSPLGVVADRRSASFGQVTLHEGELPRSTRIGMGRSSPSTQGGNPQVSWTGPAHPAKRQVLVGIVAVGTGGSPRRNTGGAGQSACYVGEGIDPARADAGHPPGPTTRVPCAAGLEKPTESPLATIRANPAGSRRRRRRRPESTVTAAPGTDGDGAGVGENAWDRDAKTGKGAVVGQQRRPC